jgi:hypothetical protein
MPSIVGKRRGAQTYYYLVESARVDGKPRIVSHEYLSTAEHLRPLRPREVRPETLTWVIHAAGHHTTCDQRKQP